MSSLRIFADSDPNRPRAEHHAGEAIAAALQERGVRFERWEAEAELPEGAAQEAVLAAYAGSVARLQAESGFQCADVVSLGPDHPQRAELRAKFLSEHTHGEDEVRFFVAGAGLFALHIGEEVLHLLCQAGDLISVPAGTKHWFDMGTAPSFSCIRLFTNPEGWVARFTGDPIAEGFPSFDDVVAAAR